MKKLFKLALVFGILFSLNSCSKEDHVSEVSEESLSPLETLLKDYPEEVTMDNWEEFVHAPTEIINYFNEKELKKVKRSQPELEPDSYSNRLVLGSSLLGEIQIQGSGINPATTYLGGTAVSITDGNTSTNTTSSNTAFYQGQNFFLSNINGLMCFYHQGITNGSYSHGDWVDGVTTWDNVIIQRHILGIEPFTQLWQHLAADINGDGTVTSADTTAITQLILGTTTSFPMMQSSSYNQPVIYFPQGDYDAVQSDLNTYLPYISSWNPVLTCQANNGDTDRYAIKRGDLNGTWSF